MSIFRTHAVIAVMTAYHPFLRIDKLEAGLHRLIVSNTLGIVTLHNTYNRLRKRHR